MLKVVKYVWNEKRPMMDQIEKKQIKISITEPQDFLKGMLHFYSGLVSKKCRNYGASESLKVASISPSFGPRFVNNTRWATEHDMR